MIGLWTWLTVAEHYTYHHYNRDVAIYANLLWHFAQGEPFQTTLLTRNVSHLGEHVVPLLLPLTVLYQLVPNVWLLLGLQQAALALAGAPVFLLARRRLHSSWAALLVLASFYLAPAVTEVAWDYVHAVAFAAVPLSFGAYFMLTGRPKLGLIVACGSILVEETSGAALFGLGLMLLLRGQVRYGAVLAGIALAWLFVVTLAIMPTFHLQETLPEDGNRTLHKFTELRQDPLQVLSLLAERGTEGLRWYLLPNAALSLLAPQTLVAALPTAGIMLFADDPLYLRSNRSAPALPLIWLATVEGLALLRGGHLGTRRQLRDGGAPRAQQDAGPVAASTGHRADRAIAQNWRLGAGLVTLAVGTVAAYLLDSRLPGGGLHDASLSRWDASSAAVQRAIAATSPTDNVVATQNAAAALALRDHVKIFPFKYAHELKVDPRDVDWWLLDLSRPDIREEALTDRDSPLRTGKARALWLPGDAPVVVAIDDPLTLPEPGAAGTFGGVLELEGLTFESNVGGSRVRLGWRVQAAPGRDLTRRLEIVDADGQVLFAQEGTAMRDFYGAARWQKGAQIVEDVDVPLNPQRLERARLRLSWHETAGGEIVPLADGAAALDLDVPR
jgi:hypothetical protein